MDFVNMIVGIGAVAVHIGFFALLITYAVSEHRFTTILNTISRHALSLGTLLGGAIILLSLYYQYVAGLPVCPLCWWQRIALYPIAALFAVAWWKGERRIFAYILPFVLFGVVVAVYHEWLQLGGASVVPCAADGSADCAKVYLNIFGYITFPVLSLTALASFLLLAWSAKK